MPSRSRIVRPTARGMFTFTQPPVSGRAVGADWCSIGETMTNRSNRSPFTPPALRKVKPPPEEKPIIVNEAPAWRRRSSVDHVGEIVVELSDVVDVAAAARAAMAAHVQRIGREAGVAQRAADHVHVAAVGRGAVHEHCHARHRRGRQIGPVGQRRAVSSRHRLQGRQAGAVDAPGGLRQAGQRGRRGGRPRDHRGEHRGERQQRKHGRSEQAGGQGGRGHGGGRE
jgi:hypothetical protein